MGKMRLKKKYRKLLVSTFIIICLMGLIYSSFNIIRWYLNNQENAKIKEKLKESIVVEKNENPELDNESIEKYKIDFQTLKQQNNDTIAYVKLNNTNIDYIVVKGNDNSYYLNHNFEKKKNNSGWIFADFHNKFDESDKNIVIFGHNTKDGSMFGTLKKVLDKDWYENKENYKVVLVTEKDTYYYQVFSTYSILAEDYYISTNFQNDEEFDRFLNTIKSRSVYDYNVSVSTLDKILTLSSCIGDGKKRVVLHAKLITNKMKED